MDAFYHGMEGLKRSQKLAGPLVPSLLWPLLNCFPGLLNCPQFIEASHILYFDTAKSLVPSCFVWPFPFLLLGDPAPKSSLKVSTLGLGVCTIFSLVILPNHDLLRVKCLEKCSSHTETHKTPDKWAKANQVLENNFLIQEGGREGLTCFLITSVACIIYRGGSPWLLARVMACSSVTLSVHLWTKAMEVMVRLTEPFLEKLELPVSSETSQMQSYSESNTDSTWNSCLKRRAQRHIYYWGYRLKNLNLK